MRTHLGIAFAAMVTMGAVDLAPVSKFMFPQLVLMRTSSGAKAIVFTHAGAAANDISRDTIAMLYGSLRGHSPKSVIRAFTCRWARSRQSGKARWWRLAVCTSPSTNWGRRESAS